MTCYVYHMTLWLSTNSNHACDYIRCVTFIPWYYAIVRIDLEIFPVASRPNKRYIRVSRTKYGGTTLSLLKYLKNYDFHSRRSENFDFF